VFQTRNSVTRVLPLLSFYAESSDVDTFHCLDTLQLTSYFVHLLSLRQCKYSRTKLTTIRYLSLQFFFNTDMNVVISLIHACSILFVNIKKLSSKGFNRINNVYCFISNIPVRRLCPIRIIHYDLRYFPQATSGSLIELCYCFVAYETPIYYLRRIFLRECRL